MVSGEGYLRPVLLAVPFGCHELFCLRADLDGLLFTECELERARGGMYPTPGVPGCSETDEPVRELVGVIMYGADGARIWYSGPVGCWVSIGELYLGGFNLLGSPALGAFW
jgi:hypothetical protein